MENYKHFEMKDKYREETGLDVYAESDMLTDKPTGSFSNKYVSWLEKIAWEGLNADTGDEQLTIPVVRLSLPTILQLFRNAKTMNYKEYSDWVKRRLGYEA